VRGEVCVTVHSMIRPCRTDLIPLDCRPSSRHIFFRSLFMSVLQRETRPGVICWRLEEAMSPVVGTCDRPGDRSVRGGRKARGVLPRGTARIMHGGAAGCRLCAANTGAVNSSERTWVKGQARTGTLATVVWPVRWSLVAAS
jgi:hypothetical protein